MIKSPVIQQGFRSKNSLLSFAAKDQKNVIPNEVRNLLKQLSLLDLAEIWDVIRKPYKQQLALKKEVPPKADYRLC